MSASRLAFVLACVLVLRSHADADPPTAADLDLAKAHYRTGELNYNRRNFNEAAREFEEAYRLSGHADLLYNMGKSYDGAGDLRGALGAYRRFLAAVQASPDRPFVEQRKGELEILIAHLTITASIVGASVLLDGEKLGTTPLPTTAIEVNPGKHSIEVSQEGYATFRATVELARAQSQRVDAQLVSLVKVIHVTDRPKTVPVYKRWYLWTGIGVVVAAAVVTGAVVGAQRANAIDGPSLQLPKVVMP